MQLLHDLGNRNIKEAIEAYPEIGELLHLYGIECINCTIGTCLLKDVVAVHHLGEAAERKVEEEINAHIAGLSCVSS